MIGLDFQKYESYCTEDFISDDNFASWVQKPEDSMLSNFWESLLRVYPEKIEAIIKARNKVLNFPVEHKSLNPQEIDLLFKKINLSIFTNN